MLDKSITRLITVGIDNGVTGAIAVVRNGVLVSLDNTPTRKFIDYQTSISRNIKRIDYPTLVRIFLSLQGQITVSTRLLLFLERPMVNAIRFHSSLSAVRSFEATLIALEMAGITPQIVSSSYWQNTITDSMWILGKAEARKRLQKKRLSKKDDKEVNACVARHIFPTWSSTINSVNADAVLLAATAYYKEK